MAFKRSLASTFNISFKMKCYGAIFDDSLKDLSLFEPIPLSKRCLRDFLINSSESIQWRGSEWASWFSVETGKIVIQFLRSLAGSIAI
jgi:hypothetical protein